ncbi:restriction endonuclease subunit S [Pseudomonas sp. NPDC089741]|uniref:restriction endonuclease subunit S n=1 Tax=Pseudomonas sp. NPDC089741 TaxID=3364470 RepID=UPI0038230CDD
MTFPAYPVYKDSGVEWLGGVPEHWVEKPFFSLLSERNESNAGMKQNNLLSLSYGRIINKDINSLEGLLPASFEIYQVVYPGDIVFRLTDLQNDKKSLRSAVVRTPGIITSAYLAVICRKILPEFANHLFRAYDNIKVFYSMGGGLRQSMKYSDMKWLPIFLPNEREQAQIARFLDHETVRVDALIEEQLRLIELLKEKRQAVISHAVIKGLDPKAQMKDSGVEWLGEVPDSWVLPKLGHIARVINGSTPSRDNTEYWTEGDIPWVASGALNDYQISSASEFITRKALAECSVEMIPQGAVLIGLVGQGKTRGLAALLNIEATINQNVCAVIPDQRKVLPSFLHLYLHCLYEPLRDFGRGANQAALNCELVSSLRIPLPSLEEQGQIVRHVEHSLIAFQTLEHHAQISIALMQERRSALISAAATGKIDVRGWQPPPSTPTPELVQEAM